MGIAAKRGCVSPRIAVDMILKVFSILFIYVFHMSFKFNWWHFARKELVAFWAGPINNFFPNKFLDFLREDRFNNWYKPFPINCLEYLHIFNLSKIVVGVVEFWGHNT